jgi:hypothetical protein
MDKIYKPSDSLHCQSPLDSNTPIKFRTLRVLLDNSTTECANRSQRNSYRIYNLVAQ